MKYLIIAGPQSSGKTTSLNYLTNRYKDKLDFHPEINQNTLFPSAKMGSIAVTSEMEKEIIQTDIQYIHDLVPSPHLQLAETSLFHLVYSYHLSPDFYQEAKVGYKQALSPHDLYIIFIDSSPSTSFARRESIYRERVRKQVLEKNINKDLIPQHTHKMMGKYQKRIEDLYPIWKRVLDEVDYAKGKIVISNDHSDQSRFLRELDQAFLTILD